MHLRWRGGHEGGRPTDRPTIKGSWAFCTNDEGTRPDPKKFAVTNDLLESWEGIETKFPKGQHFLP